jgi:hypothetical protein
MIGEVTFFPESGDFPLEKLRLYLSDFVFLVIHPAQKDVFCLCGNKGAADACRETLENGGAIPPVAVVRLTAGSVAIGLRCECAARIQAAEFAAIVLGRFRVGRIEDEEGNEIHEKLRDIGVLDFFGVDCFEDLSDG